MQGQERALSGRAVLSTNTILAFLALGLSGSVIGPSLPWMAEHWHVSLADTGILFTVLFVGSCLTVSLSGVLLDRIGRKPIIVAGVAGLGVGQAGLALAPGLLPALAATLVLGLGWGCLDVTLNVFIADLYPESRGAALNLTNVFFGVGALAGPVLIGGALTWVGVPAPVLLAISVGACILAAVFLMLRFPPHVDEGSGGAALSPGRIVRQPYVLLVGLIFFLYVGLEIGFGGWVYSFATEGAGLAAGPASLVVSTFWLAFTVGRAAAGVLTRQLRETLLVSGGAALAAVGVAGIALFGSHPVVLFVGAALVGAGFAPVFPTAFGLATARYPGSSGAVSSVLVLGGSLGGAVLPFLLGLVLAAGGVPVAAGAIAGLALIIAALQVAVGRRFSGPVPAAASGPSASQSVYP